MYHGHDNVSKDGPRSLQRIASLLCSTPTFQYSLLLCSPPCLTLHHRSLMEALDRSTFASLEDIYRRHLLNHSITVPGSSGSRTLSVQLEVSFLLRYRRLHLGQASKRQRSSSLCEHPLVQSIVFLGHGASARAPRLHR